MEKQKRVLLIIPENLLELTDEAAALLQITRLGFIRQCIAFRLASFNENEKPLMQNLFKVENDAAIKQQDSVDA